MTLSPKLISATRRTLLALAVLLTLTALFVVVENWRGDRAWRQFEAELNARGESLTTSSFATPPVPDARNFFKAPVVEAMIYKSLADPAAAKLFADARACQRFKAPEAALADLEKLRAYWRRSGWVLPPPAASPHEEVLSALQPAAPFFTALRQAAEERPVAWLPFRSPTEKPMLEIGEYYNVGRLLAYRARMEVGAGRMDDAFADIELTLRLAEHLRTGPKTLLQMLIGQGLYGIVAEVIEAGCRRHAWSDAQLAAWQRQFEANHPLAQLQESLRAERVWVMAYFDTFTADSTTLPRPWWFIRGVAQRNKIAASTFTEASLASIDPAADRIDPAGIARLAEASAKLQASRGPNVWMARLVAGKFGKIIPDFGGTVNRSHRALVAIGLERHRLAHGSYPESLAALTPAILARVPHDVLSAEPLGYVRLSADNYSLSHRLDVGPNRQTWVLQDAK